MKELNELFVIEQWSAGGRGLASFLVGYGWGPGPKATSQERRLAHATKLISLNKTKEKQFQQSLIGGVGWVCFVGGYGAEPICRREIPFHWFH